MRSVSRPAVVALAALMVGASLGIGATLSIGSHHPPPSSSLVSDLRPVPKGAATEPLPGATPISVTLTLEGRDPSALDGFLRLVEDPASPDFDHFLTPKEFEATFSPTPAAAQEAAAVLSSAGGRDVAIAPDRLTVTGVLPAATVGSLFGVSLVAVGEQNGVPLYTAVGSPSLPPGLQGVVSGIGGLSNLANVDLSYGLERIAPVRFLGGDGVPAYIEGNTSGAQWFLGSDFTEALGASELFPGSGTPNATFPTHVAVATLLVGGWNETYDVNLPPWNPAVVHWYLNSTLGPGWPISNVTGVPVTIGGVTPPLPGPSNSTNDSTDDSIENSLDLEMVGSLAPGAPVYNFYFAGSFLAGGVPLSDIADDFGLELSDALSYNYSPARLGVVSGSFGLPDTNDSAWNSALQMAAATGVTLVMASGDQGNAPDSLSGRSDGQWPDWPASAAFNDSGSIAVGGVTLTLSGPTAGWYNSTGFEVEFDANTTGIASVVTWYDTTGGPGNIAGSEGGMSQVYSEPIWQFDSAAQPSIANASVLEGLSTLNRAEPDVAFPANDTIVAWYENSTGAIFGFWLEGTSIAAPVFAGLIADLIAVRSGNGIGPTWQPLGFLDPELYRMGSYFAAFPGAPHDPFVSVTVGSNYVFSAAPGWNPTTGWGVLRAVPMLSALANRTIADFLYTGPTPGIPPRPPAPAVPWTEIYLIFGVGLTAAVVLVLVVARPSRRAPSDVPWGAQMGSPPFPPGAAGGPHAGATFLCPYCGSVRPAEPVRCPRCGAW